MIFNREDELFNVENDVGPKLNDLFTQSPIAIELYDVNGALLDANQACFELFGIQSLEEVKDFNLFEDPNLNVQIISDIRSGKAIKYEFIFSFDLVKSKKIYNTTREGTCYLECYTNPATNESNETTGYIVYITDITERKKAENLLELQAKELKELNSTKDKFLSIIAHDLKNPFNAILGFSDLMLKNFYQLDDETLLKGLSTIESASVQAYKLLENLLIWSQNQTGRSKFTPEILKLKAQVMESLSAIESTATKKEIHVVIDISKSLQIFADKNMIDSIFRNLISNAIKFSHKKAKIKITAISSDDEIQISVIDHGVGITTENQSAIFKIDQHLITLGTDNEQGTGLGLILCKDFITKHNGNIWVESTPGKGSIFTISLPFN